MNTAEGLFNLIILYKLNIRQFIINSFYSLEEKFILFRRAELFFICLKNAILYSRNIEEARIFINFNYNNFVRKLSRCETF